MVTEDYTRTLNSMLSEQGATPTVSDMRLSIRYPLHLHFPDLRRGHGGRYKKYYEPIYNKYVAGYLYGGYVTGTITRTLNNVD